MDESLTTTAIIPSSEFYDAAGIAYEKGYANNAGQIRALKAFIAHLPLDSLVLDCGCGTGRPVAEMIVQSGHRVHGIDWSPNMVRLSQQRIPSGTFEHVNMLDYAPEEKNFDGIVASMSLFELGRANLETMAGRWGRWIKPGGIILIGVFGADDCDPKPEQFDADGKFVRGLYLPFMGAVTNSDLFTRSGWDELLEAQGFAVLSRTMEVFRPSEECGSHDEPDYFVIARMKES